MKPCDMCAAEQRGANECQRQLTHDITLLNSQKVHIVPSRNLTRETIHALAGVVRALLIDRLNKQSPPT
jgi:hypothetical protein